MVILKQIKEKIYKSNFTKEVLFMKQMTKEELIEYFIEQLGDNEILGKVMSIEQIREKLNYIIKDVTYNDEPGNSCGQWIIDKDGKGTVKFDPQKILWYEESVTIVHELLHALSTSIIAKYDFQNIGHFIRLEQIKEKCGLHKISKIYVLDSGGHKEGGYGAIMAINEGMTDTLAELITGKQSNGYTTEKDVYKILSIIIGQDTMLKKYFSDDVEQKVLGEDPLKEELIKKYGKALGEFEYKQTRGKLVYSEDLLKNTFEEELIKKYGKTLGETLFDDFKKVSGLLDQLLDLDRKDAIYGLNENGRTIHSKAREELYSTLENMIENIIEHEPDIMKKIDNIFIPLLKTSQGRHFYTRILNQLAVHEELEVEQKIELFKKIKSVGNMIPSKIETEFILKLLSSNTMTAEDKINYYWTMRNGTGRCSDKLYEWYVESGLIKESEAPKSKIFAELFGLDYTAYDKDSVKGTLLDTKYQKVGKSYLVSDSLCDLFLINEYSEMVKPNSLRYSISKDGFFELHSWDLPKNLKEKEQREKLTEQIARIYQENAELDMNTNFETYDNILVEELIDNNKTKHRKFYEIQPDGTLKEIEPRS